MWCWFRRSERALLAALLRLEQINLGLQVEVAKMSATVDSLTTEIAALTQAVADEQAVEASAVTLINGFAAQLAAAVAAAQAQGATPDQLAALNALVGQIGTSSQALAAAVAANTPAAPPATP